MNICLFALGVILLIYAIYNWVFSDAPEGHEDENGFHRH